MLLSSVNRTRIYISSVESASRSDLSDGVANDGELLGWLTSASAQIEKSIKRTILTAAYTEYFNVSFNRITYFPKAYPITTLTSVYEDSSGEYDGAEAEVTNPYIGIDENTIVLDAPVWHGYPTKKGLRIIYTGGMAAHGVNSTFAIGTVSGTWTAGKYVEGATSGAMGLVVSATATAIVIANLYGIFIVGDVLQEQDTEGTQGTSDGAATITSVTAQSLAEAYPDVARACEMQVRYNWKHKLDFENSTSSPEGTIRRRPDLIEGQLQPEVLALLQGHARMVIA